MDLFPFVQKVSIFACLCIYVSFFRGVKKDKIYQRFNFQREMKKKHTFWYLPHLPKSYSGPTTASEFAIRFGCRLRLSTAHFHVAVHAFARLAPLGSSLVIVNAIYVGPEIIPNIVPMI